MDVSSQNWPLRRPCPALNDDCGECHISMTFDGHKNQAFVAKVETN